MSTEHDRWIASPATDDPAFSVDPDAIIDEMVSEPDCFDQWLIDMPFQPSVSSLLSLILDRGLPSMDKSESDDELRDVYETRMKSVRDDFAEWAQQPTRFKPAPIDQWRENGL